VRIVRKAAVPYLFVLLGFLFFVGCDREKTIRNLNKQALQLEARGDSEGAISNYTQAIGMYPKSLELSALYANRADAECDLGQYDKSISDCNRALEIDPLNSTAIRQRGMTEYRLEQYDKTISDINRALSIDPTNSLSFLTRGMAKVREGDLENSISDFRASIRFHPKNPMAFWELGFVNYQLSDFEIANISFARAIELGVTNSNTYLYRGASECCEATLDITRADMARYAKLELKEAIADFDETLKLDPTNGAAYFFRGFARMIDTNWEASVSDLSRSIELNPTNVGAYFFKGCVEFRERDFDTSIQDLTIAIRLKPNDCLAYGTRAWVKYLEGDVAGAGADSRKAIQLYEHDPEGIQSYKRDPTLLFYQQILLDRQSCQQGLIDYIDGNFKKAVTDWEDAIQQEPRLRQELEPWIKKAQRKLQ
jgi:tetratricopeptide (TPR) repeat protein